MDLEGIISTAITNALRNSGAVNNKKSEFDLIDLDKASKLTGYSKHTLYRLTSRQEIPFTKRRGGRKLFFSKKRLELWLLSEK